jgi:hypothetical protein
VVQGHLLAPYAVKDHTLLHRRPLLASCVMQAISLQLLVRQHYAKCAVTQEHQARQQEQALALSVPKDGTPITLVLPQPVLHVVPVSIPQPLRQPAKGRASTAMLVHIKVFGVYRLVFRVQRARFRLEGVQMHVISVHEASSHRPVLRRVPFAKMDHTCQAIVLQSVICASLECILQDPAKPRSRFARSAQQEVIRAAWE